MARWIDTAGYMLGHPGAHPPGRQLADSANHDAAMAAWLEGFLKHWLK